MSTTKNKLVRTYTVKAMQACYPLLSPDKIELIVGLHKSRIIRNILYHMYQAGHKKVKSKSLDMGKGG